jgi:hypothetical protein
MSAPRQFAPDDDGEEEPHEDSKRPFPHAPPPSLMLDPSVMQRVYGDVAPDGKDTDYTLIDNSENVEAGEKPYVPVRRLTNAQLAKYARENILAMRRRPAAAAAAPSSLDVKHGGGDGAASAAVVASSSSQPLDELAFGFLGATNRVAPPLPVTLPGFASEAAAAVAAGSASPPPPPLQNAEDIDPEELRAEMERLRLASGCAPKDHVLRRSDDEVQEQRRMIEARKLAELEERMANMSVKDKKKRESHQRKYASTPYLDDLDELIATLRRKEQDEKRRVLLWDAEKAARRDDSAATAGVVAGDLRYQVFEENKQIVALANKFEYSPMQILLLDAFAQACAPLIYADDWLTSEMAFLKRHNLTEQNWCAMGLAPRRFGKTWAIVALLLALAMSIPGLKIIVFSQNERTSKALVAKLRKNAMAIEEASPEWQGRFPSRDQRRMVVLPLDVKIEGMSRALLNKHPRASTITALPCTADGMFLFFSLPSLSRSRPHAGGGGGRWQTTNIQKRYVHARVHACGYGTEKKKCQLRHVNDRVFVVRCRRAVGGGALALGWTGRLQIRIGSALTAHGHFLFCALRDELVV